MVWLQLGRRLSGYHNSPGSLPATPILDSFLLCRIFSLHNYDRFSVQSFVSYWTDFIFLCNNIWSHWFNVRNRLAPECGSVSAATVASVLGSEGKRADWDEFDGAGRDNCEYKVTNLLG